MGDYFGVDVPNNFDLPTEGAPDVAKPEGATDTAPEVGKEASEKPEATNVDKPATPVVAKPELVDIDKLERLRWKGQELTRKELEDRQLRYEDYTRKVQQTSEVRKFSEAFPVDLDKVVEDPSLMEAMRKLYPPEYVKAAERVLARLSDKKEDAAIEKPSALPPEIVRKLEKVEKMSEWQARIDKRIEEANLQQSVKVIDDMFDKLTKEFPEADDTYVQSKLRDHVEEIELRGEKVGKERMEKLAQTLFKQDHERMVKRMEDRYRAKFEAQKTAATKAKDIGAGGGTPSAPPVRAKTIDEATALAISDAKAGRI